MNETRCTSWRRTHSLASLLLFIGVIAAPATSEAQYIRSVEYVEISLGAGETTDSTGLTKGQDIANCIPFASMMSTGTDDDFDQSMTDVYFQAGPQVTAQRQVSGGTVDLGVFVVEFDPAYVSVQQNTFSFSGASTTVGITGVDLTKAALTFYYRGSFGSHKWMDHSVAGRFSATNQLSFQRDSSDGTVTGHWYVFEALNNEFSVVPFNLSISGGSTSGTTGISTVDMSKSFVIASYRTAYDDDNARSAAAVVYLNNPAQVRAERDYDSSLAISDIRGFVVTLTGPWIVQRGSFTYGGAQDQATISAVNPAAAFASNGVSMPGPGVAASGANSSGDVENSFQRIKLIDSTTVQGDRAESSFSGVGRWEVIGIPANVNYRSIGSASDLVDEGTITVTSGSATVTKSGGLGWLSENRGRGDVLIVGADEYMIAAVISDDDLRLVAPATTTYTGPNYTIARQHTTLQSWHDCVDNTAVCPYFPVSSPSLVTDDRSEVGIAYADSTFMPTAQVLMEGATTDDLHTVTLTADGTNRHYGVPGDGVVIDGQSLDRGIRVDDSYTTLEWLEIQNVTAHDSASVLIRGAAGQWEVLVQNLLIHDFLAGGMDVKGIGIQGGGGKLARIRNTMIWAGDYKGIEGDETTDTIIIENVTVDNMDSYGIDCWHSAFSVYNTISTSNSSGDFVMLQGDGSLTGTHNTSSDTTAGTFFTSFQNSISAASLYVTPNANLHLMPAVAAVNTGTPRSGFATDIDNQGRPAGAGWDRGADEEGATTAVSLSSFTASSQDGAVELAWETASELNNLGFHVYRATAAAGEYERLTERPIPGLGSSPVGARYRYDDTGVENDIVYYYKLEDIDTSGVTTWHGPVSATATAKKPGPVGDTPSRALITFGDPAANSLRVVRRSRRGLELELVTHGFHAEPLDDGSVRLHIPGFESVSELGGPSIPIESTWVEAIAGRKVTLASVRASDIERFTHLRPSGAELPEIIAAANGTVRAARQRGKTAFRSDDLSPAFAARVASVGFQEDVKKALVELAPLRWDGARGQLLLARRLVVRVSFREREPSERAGRGYTRRRSHDTRSVIAHLHTSEKGLHRVRFEDVLRGRRGVEVSKLRLSRQGETVAFHVDARRFTPGSALYFVSKGSDANPYGNEAVYELEVGGAGETMALESSRPSGSPQRSYWQRSVWEEDRYYQAALVEAPDRWLWDLLFAPQAKSYPVATTDLASGAATLRVQLQGVSDLAVDPDHHVRAFVNGMLVGELSWDGKQATTLEMELAPGVLREGENVLELENVGDTGADYSMVMLDRYAVEYPRRAHASDSRLEGRWGASGTAEVSGLTDGAHVLDTSGPQPRWLVDTELGADGVVRFRAASGHRYLAVSPGAVHEPRVSRPRASRLKNARNRADYLLIGPDAFLEAAAPLVELREREGLKVERVSIEEIYSEFGFGETTPEGLKDFLGYAYHHWRQPSPRYVLLLGDASFDFKDHLQTGVTNQVPARMVKTSYLWTASDPSLAAVNGEDSLPDLAIGRLPAASLDEVRSMVAKIVAYEQGEFILGDRVVLVTDDPDSAGNFDADADELAGGVLSGRSVRTLLLSELGVGAARNEILQAFDEGSTLMSYLGHGGIHLWADENIFDIGRVDLLSAQERQPFLVTMNCLNGYFHFPYFNSLAEELVKAEGRGAIAAFSPSGLSLNDPAHLYHQALLREVLEGNHARLGDAVLAAQRAYAETGAFPELLSIYHLLGDPALGLR